MCPTIVEIGVWLWNWDFSRFGTSHPFRSCEMRVTVLRNEGHCAAKWHSCAKIAFAAAKYPAEWDFGCEIENFHALELRSRFAAAKWGSLCVGMALVWQKCFRSREILCGMGLLLRNQPFSLRNAFRSCETDAPVLRSGTRVPKWVSQLRKFSQRLLQCCGMVWQQNAISQRLRNLADPCFSPVSPLFSLRLTPILLRFCSDFFSSISLQFLLILIIQKPILHQNKLDLKHWNQN